MKRDTKVPPGAGLTGFLIGLFLLNSMAFSQARETYAELPGVRLWFKDSGGNGAPVVLLHANTGSSRSWELQFPAFTAAGFRVIAYDRRGWGRSTPQPGAEPGTAADDLRALMKFLGINRFHMVATAGGGFVAYDYALSFPEQLRSLVVSNSVGGMQDPDYLELHQRLRPPEFAAMPAEIREVGPAYRAANPEGTRRWIELEKMGRQPNATAQPFRNQMRFAMLESIKRPTFLIAGDADMFAPPPFLKMFTSRIKGAQTLVIPEAGHSSYWEKPEVFNKAVLDFIRKH
jgi:pimeloyl-ACP methyl ester carboxylesterase